VTERNERVRELFLAAKELDSFARESFLASACVDDHATRKEVESLLAYDQEDPFLDQPVLPRPSDQSIGLNETTTARAQDPDRLSPSEVVGGRYKILEAIGSGGFGIVYLAEQREPVRRRVALKMLKPGMDSSNILARFEAERQAMAMMDHPGIAKLFDGGLHRHRPYFVMELVSGTPITEFCDANRMATRDRVALFRDVCDAVHHAHLKGIIHRDLKPSNVLITLRDGTPVPKIIDFGIAKALSGPLTERTLYTEFRQMIGTPEYMSPEQAETSEMDVDVRSDVYSLGIMLYELLTGTRPFDWAVIRKAGLLEMQRTIREVEPPRPSFRLSSMGAQRSIIADRRKATIESLSGSLKGDLDWLVMKAIERQRQRRYGSALALGEDVSRWLVGAPIVARPPSVAYLTSKWIRAHQKIAIAGITMLLAAFIAVGGIGYGWAAKQSASLQQQLDQQQTETLKRDAKREQQRSEQLAYGNAMHSAEESFRYGRRSNTAVLLESCPPSQRGVEWQWLQDRCIDRSSILRAHQDGPALGVAFVNRSQPPSSQDADPIDPPAIATANLLSVGSDGMLRVWDHRAKTEIRSWRAHPAAANLVVLSRDGELAATGGEDGTVAVWNLGDGRLIERLTFGQPVTSIALTNGAARLAAGGREGMVRIWNRSADDKLLALTVTIDKAHSGAVFSTYFIRDDQVLGTAGRGGVFAWDPNSGNKLASGGAYWQSYGVVLDQEHDQFAVFGPPVEVYPINADGFPMLRSWSMSNSGIECAAILPGTQVALLATDDDALRTIDLQTGQQQTMAFGNQGRIHALAASPDGRHVALAAADGTIRVWATEHFAAPRALSPTSSGVATVATSATHFASISVDGLVSLWDRQTNALQRQWKLANQQGFSIDFTHDGSLLLANGISNDSKMVASAWSTQTLEAVDEFNLSLGARFLIADPKQSRWIGPLSPDRSRYSASSLQTEGAEGWLGLWDVPSRSITQVYKGLSNWAMGLDVSPDGRLLAAASVQGEAFVWDVATAAIVGRFRSTMSNSPSLLRDQVKQVMFLGQGEQLVTAHGDGHVSVWRVDKGEERLRIQAHGDEIVAIERTADGKRLLTAGRGDGRFRVWDLDNGVRVAEFDVGTRAIADMELCDDQSSLLIGSESGETILFPLRLHD
jgi:eukaryotic-like serine/threonine-protein kinase